MTTATRPTSVDPRIVPVLGVGAGLVVGALVGLSPLVLVGLFGLAVVLAVLRCPDLVTPAVLAAMYANVGGVLVQEHGLPLVVGAAIPAALCWPALRSLVLDRCPLVVDARFWAVLAFAIVQTAGMLVAVEPKLAADEVRTILVEGLALYLLVTHSVRTRRVLEWCLVAVVAVGCAVSALSVVQYATGNFSQEFFGFAKVENFDPAGENPFEKPRAAGPVGEKNYFAQVLMMLVPIAFVGLARDGSLRGWLATAATALLLAGVAVTFSRGAILAFGVLLAVATLLGVLSRRLFVVGLLVAALGIVAVPQLRERAASIGRLAHLTSGRAGVQRTDKATQGRLTEMVAAARVFARHPLVGVGPAMFPVHFQSESTALGFQVHADRREAHSLYLHLAAEHGLLGLLTFAAVVVLHVRGLQEARRRSRDELVRHVATALLLSFVAFLACGLLLSFKFVRFFWLVAGLAAATCRLADESQESSEPHRLRALEGRVA